MSTCINKKSPEYQILKNKSGIQNFILEALCRDYLDKYGRFPYLDELSQSNSEPHLRNRFKIKENNSTNISTILEETGKSTIDEATIDINNEYRDLEVQITPIVNEAIVDVTHRPTNDNFNITPVEVDSNINSYMVFNESLEKLANLYGINFNTVTDAELTTPEWREVSPDIATANAFVYNGEIYINIDRNSVDAPLHELMHILIGSMRFTNPLIYQELVNSVENFPNYQVLANKYNNRSRNDINEEIFVTETAKYLMGVPSNIDNFDQKLLNEINYNTKRVLDSILMGQDSVKTLTNDQLYTKSFKELAQAVNSSVLNNQFKGFINVEGSELHRKLNNIKADLFKNNQLEEYCN